MPYVQQPPSGAGITADRVAEVIADGRRGSGYRTRQIVCSPRRTSSPMRDPCACGSTPICRRNGRPRPPSSCSTPHWTSPCSPSTSPPVHGPFRVRRSCASTGVPASWPCAPSASRGSRCAPRPAGPSASPTMLQAPVAPMSNRRGGTLEVRVRPPGSTGPTDLSPWEGMSGAAVWVADRIVGVVTEHHHAEGPGTITAARLDGADAAAVREALGLPTDAAALPPVGSGRHLPSAYRQQVLDIAPALAVRSRHRPRRARARGRRRAAVLVVGRPAVGREDRADSWFVLHPPAGVDVVSFFVAAGLAGQSDADACLEALAEQLTVLAGRPAGARTRRPSAGACCAACSRRPRSAVARRGASCCSSSTGSTRTPARPARAPSVASLVPRRPPDGLRVVVTSRSGHELPGDVDPDHPLRRWSVDRSHPRRSPSTARPGPVAELTGILTSTTAAVELLGLVTAARGGLDHRDLAALTGTSEFAVEETAARGRRAQPHATGPPVARIDRCRGIEQRLPVRPPHSPRGRGRPVRAGVGPLSRPAAGLGRRYRRRRWPADTPVYLLRDLPRALAAARDAAGSPGWSPTSAATSSCWTSPAVTRWPWTRSRSPTPPSSAAASGPRRLPAAGRPP